MANKLDQGIHYEFRAGEPTTAGNEDETPDQKALRSHTAMINDVGRRIALIEPVEGQILHLPVYENGDGNNGVKKEDGVPAKKKEEE